MKKYERIMDEFLLIVILAIVPVVVLKVGSDYYTNIKLVVGIVGVVIYMIYGALIKKVFGVKVINIVLGILGLIIILATINSVNSIKSLIGEFGRLEGCIALLYYLLIFIIFSSGIKKPSKKAVILLWIITTFIAVYTIYQFYFWDPFVGRFVGRKYQYSSISTLGNRNFVSSYLIMWAVIYVGLYIVYSKRIYYISSLVFFAALLASLTRSGWIAMVVVMLIIAFMIYKLKLSFRRYLTLILSFGCILVFMSFTNPMLGGRFASIKEDVKRIGEENHYKNGSGRIYIWKNSIGLVLDRPLLGSGPDTFQDVFKGNFNGDNYKYLKQHTIFDKAHNEYLQLAITIGIPYLIVYCLLILSILKNMYIYIEGNLMILPVFLAIIAYMIQGFFNISTVGVAPMFWLLLGLGVNFTAEEYKYNKK